MAPAKKKAVAKKAPAKKKAPSKMSTENKIKFVIIGQPRTGSTLLHTCLRQHSDIQIEGELLHQVPGEREERHFINANGKYYDPRDASADQFLDEYLWSSSSTKSCVGFKYFPYYSVEHSREKLFHKFSQENVKMVHIKRRNKLDLWASFEAASQKKQFAIFNGHEESNIKLEKIYVTPQKMHEHFNSSCKIDNKISEYFRGKNYMELNYEYLAKRTIEAVSIVFDFLGLNSVPVEIKMRKQNNLGPSAILANYEELEEYFSQTVYKSFFD